MDFTFFDVLTAKPSLFTGVALMLLVVIEVAARRYKHKIKTEYDRAKEDADYETIAQLTLQLNKRTQMVEISRVLAYIIFALLMVLAYDVQAFSVVLLAIGALIIVLKETVGSFFAYFVVVYQYDIGDDIRINTFIGEVIRIYTLNTWLAGKEESGEYNGRLIMVPNYMFMQGAIEKQELKSSSFRHIVMSVVYIPGSFEKPFDEWLTDLKAFLDDTLPLRKLGSVGHFRGYAGIKYKIRYDYNEDGHVVLRIAFVSSTSSASYKKETIVRFVERSKKIPSCHDAVE